MSPDELSLVEWLRQSLREYFPGQALNVRASGIDTLVVDVTDPSGQPRELRFAIDELPYRKGGGPSGLVQFPEK
jgi:hypothetical protein